MGFWEWIFGRSDEPNATPLAFAAPSAPPRLPAAAPPPPVPEAPPLPAIPPKPAPPRYGVDAVIALMRALPMDEDPELVLRVVRKTLRSTGVSVEELIENARTREGSLLESIADDRKAIEQLERDIADRRARIETVGKQLNETTSVRERLQEAVQTESKVGILLPPEEIARLQAAHVGGGAAGAMSSRIPPPPVPAGAGASPTSVAPSPPKTSVPPVPKASVAPPLVKSVTPQPPRVAPSQAPKVAEPPKESAAKDELVVPVATPVAPDVDSLFETDGPVSEPTVRKAVDVTSGAPSEDAEKSL